MKYLKIYEEYEKTKTRLGHPLTIVTDKKGNEYVLQMFVTSNDALIPYRDSPAGLPKEKYWEHFWIPKEEWIRIKDIKWEDFNITEDEYIELKLKSNIKEDEILKKYKSSS